MNYHNFFMDLVVAKKENSNQFVSGVINQMRAHCDLTIHIGLIPLLEISTFLFSKVLEFLINYSDR